MPGWNRFHQSLPPPSHGGCRLGFFFLGGGGNCMTHIRQNPKAQNITTINRPNTETQPQGYYEPDPNIHELWRLWQEYQRHETRGYRARICLHIQTKRVLLEYGHKTSVITLPLQYIITVGNATKEKKTIMLQSCVKCWTNWQQHTPFSRTTTRVLKCCRPCIMVNKVANSFCSESHLPALRQRIFLYNTTHHNKLTNEISTDNKLHIICLTT